jgi:phosphoglycolate phosphatase
VAPAPPPVRAVVFDLDGTLVQTRVASWEVFSRINDRYRLGVDSPERYFDLFRSNVFASIRSLCRDEAHADEVKAAFLALLRTDYTPAMIPGMSDVVRRLAGDCTLAVMSSNAMQVLRRVLVANDLAFCFAHVFGGDVAPDKRAAIRTFLADSGSGFGRRCAADYDEAGRHAEPAAASTVLVTDTAGDVRDARETGIRVVGVAWGMHSVDELLDAGAEFVALWPQEITAYLLGDAAVQPPGGACAVPAHPAKDRCRCGCSGAEHDDPVRVAAAARRRRRTAARAHVLAALPPAMSPTPGAPRSPAPPERRTVPASHHGAVPAELLAAVRAVCADG